MENLSSVYVFKRKAKLDKPIEYLSFREPFSFGRAPFNVKTQISDYYFDQ